MKTASAASKLESEVSTHKPAKQVKDPDYQDFEIKDAAESLMKAEGIKSNPKLMHHVHKHMGKMKKAISSVAELRKIASEKNEEMEG